MATLTGLHIRTPVSGQQRAAHLPSKIAFKPCNAAAFSVHAPCRSGRSTTLHIQNFKFLKNVGLKKPGFLPDFGKEKRKAVLDRFYTNFDAQTYDELLADGFELVDTTEPNRKYSKQDWKRLMLDHVIPAIPDFSWSHATDGTKDEKDGFSTVVVKATGHHTGQAFSLPTVDAPAVQPSGKKFQLAEEKIRVKVEDGQIQKMEVLGNKGAGPRALYEALGGKTPATV
ncbi:g6322 [Coccomyxa viridis]|uniref:G6322 protein n=1 Tax=Coccomyxa viridis TaxID=1274662 RepID=A0ABP1FXP4_9CHLO